MKNISALFLTLIFVIGLKGQLTGGSITIEAGSKPRQVHRFNASTSSPALVWPRTSTDTANDVKISIVGGGGGGGAGVGSPPNTNGAGGGGGGEVKELSIPQWLYLDMITSNDVTVGAGGVGATASGSGSTGGASSFAINNGTANTTYSASGGIGGVGSNGSANSGGSNGNTARTGGSGANAGKVWAGGGGGGAAANGGAAASSTLGGVGGAGSQLLALTSTLICGGGGGGGASGTAGVGGSGGGVTGGTIGATVATPTVNLGGGGGGATNSGGTTTNGGAGGSGVVVISYKKYDTYIATVNGSYNSTGWSGPSNVLTTNAYKHVFAGAFTITIDADLNHAGELFVVESGTTLTIDAGKTFTCKTLIVYGTLVNNGTLSCTNVFFAAVGGGQTIPAGSYTNLTLSNASGINTVGGAISVDGTLTTTAGGTLALANNILTLSAGSTLTNGGTISTTMPTATSASWVTDSRNGSGTGTTLGVYGGTISYAATTGAQTIVSGTYTNLTLLNTSNSNVAGGVVTVGGVLTTTSGGTLALANNILTLSAGSTFINNGTISTTIPTTTSTSWVTDSRNGSGAGTTPGVFSGTISYAASSGAQTIVTGTYENLTLSNTSGTNTTATAITVTGILNSTAGGKIQINSSGSLTLSGTLAQSQVHVIDGDIELNGGDFIVSGKKDKDKVVSDLIVNPTLPTPPYMIIRGSINDVLTSSFRQNSIKFVPSNATGKESHIRFAGSGKTLGNISSSANMSIQTNDNAYFEIGDGTSSVTLTLQDTLRLNNGLRMRSNATLSTSSGMLQLLSSSSKIQGQQKSVGFIDTSVANSISGSICFVQTMSASRKLRFLGNPFEGDLNIADFTDDIDITGDRTGVNNNNFTQTANNTASAYTYDNATDAWVAITNTSPTKLLSKQGMKIFIRGQKGYGLDANNGSPSSSRIILNGVAILGDQTISLSNGYNFICNPFLSPVDLDKISKTTNVADVIYMYNPSSSGYQTYNKNSKDLSVGGADIWSAGASLFFQATTTGQSITIEEQDKYNVLRKAYNPHFLETDTFHNIANIIIKNDLGRVSLVDDITLDLGGRLNASDNYDILYDGLDFGGDSVNVSILSKDNKYLSYCATNPLSNNEIRRYPLSLTIKNNSLNGNYTLQFDQFKAFQSDINVTLVDHWLNKTVDLIKNPQVKFYINDQKESQGLNRFEIVINKAIVSTQELLVNRALDFIISSNSLNNGLDFTPIGASANNVLLIYDLQGNLIRNYDRFNASVSILNEEMMAGVYLATQICGKAKLTKKFIIIK